MLLYMVFAGLHLLSVLPDNVVFQRWIGDWGHYPVAAAVLSALALVSGAVGLYYMYRCYRIPARPFWNHWQTGSSFVGSALALGGIVCFWFMLLSAPASGAAENTVAMHTLGAGLIVVAALIEGLGLWQHARAMNVANNEGSVSHYIQTTVFAKSYLLRNALLLLSAVIALSLTLTPGGIASGLIVAALSLCVLGYAVIGRALFYVLVVPTTMPGAFFWKNKDFEEHARDIGLANLPQVGVVADLH